MNEAALNELQPEPGEDPQHLSGNIPERKPAEAEGSCVVVPPDLRPLFDKAQETVREYFTGLVLDPMKGTIEINDQRYVLVRASALSKDFLDTVQGLYADRGEDQALSIGKNFLFDVAHVIGMNDAKDFHQRMDLTEPIARLSAGPVHFAYTGWAFVEILPESVPTPDENFYLLYRHPYSFEADSWNRSGKKAASPVCIMNAGYSSGWCEESFGIPLTAVEVSCTARGDAHCTFIMSPPDKIQQHVAAYTAGSGGEQTEKVTYDIPTFFERKKVEEEMQRSRLLAEESGRAKEDFVANMSHELRTPLGAILGFAELLRKTALSAEQKEYLDAIQSSGNGLLSIINDVLDLSKLDAGGITAGQEPFSPSELLQALRTMFAPKAAEKGLQFRLLADPAIPATLTGDALRLKQVLVNLVSNAIKFTEKGSVEIHCFPEREEEGVLLVRFSICDTGIGIPEEKRKMIFERFTQAETDTSRKYGGTGLGLAISRQLVDLMGGSLSVESRPGGGSCFSCLLPFAQLPHPPIPVPDSSGSVAVDPSKIILVVEDNLMNQRLTSLMLHNNGLIPHLVNNGEEAMQFLKRQKADLILMDLQMPVMDGFRATCAIREELQLQTPIVAMTAHAFAGEKEKCFLMGVNDYLPKPFTELELLQKVAQWTYAVAVHPPLPDREHVLDFSYLIRQTRGNKAVIGEMIRLFREQALNESEALKEAVAQKEFGTIYRTAHLLRNAISLVGLTPLIGAQLLQMEQWARGKENMAGIEANWMEVEPICARAVRELEDLDVAGLC